MRVSSGISRFLSPELAVLARFAAPIYRHRLHSGYRYTDTVRQTLCETGCFWVIDRIFALQQPLSAVLSGRSQLWTLENMADVYLTITCLDHKTGDVLYCDHGYPEQRLPHDFAFILQKDTLRVAEG